MSRPPLPPFSAETAAQKARLAEDAWNTREPARVAQAYTPDSIWRNRAEFIRGREEIVAFLTRKWNREPALGETHEAARAHRFCRRCGELATRCAGAAADRQASDWLSRWPIARSYHKPLARISP